MTRTLSSLLAVLVLVAGTTSAEVVRFEIQSRADLVSGMSFGLAGSYEKIVGTVYFEVDPANPANRIITDIDFAPRNAAGKVEFHSDFYLIKPKDVTRGNGTVFYEVSNRGRKGILGYFNNAEGTLDPQTAEQMCRFPRALSTAPLRGAARRAAGSSGPSFITASTRTKRVARRSTGSCRMSLAAAAAASTTASPSHHAMAIRF